MGIDCKYCGAYIASGFDACPACGKKIKEEPASSYNKYTAGTSAAENASEKRYSGYSTYGAGAAAAYAPAQEQKKSAERDLGNKQNAEENTAEKTEEEHKPYTYKDVYKERFKEHEKQSGGFTEEEKEKARVNNYNSVSFENENDIATKILAILGYLGPIGLLPFFLGNKQERSFLRFHAIQGLLMTLITVIVNNFIGSGIGVLAEIAWGIVHVLAAIYCIAGIFKGEKRKLPILGDIASKDD